jgi:hypothetical protein
MTHPCQNGALANIVLLFIAKGAHIAFCPFGLLGNRELNIGDGGGLQKRVQTPRLGRRNNDQGTETQCFVRSEVVREGAVLGGPLVVEAISVAAMVEEDDQQECESRQQRQRAFAGRDHSWAWAAQEARRQEASRK